jgi:hypothetical protein
MADKTPPGFLFALSAFQRLTVVSQSLAVF